jgi:maltose/moltooligosaccharide transporter
MLSIQKKLTNTFYILLSLPSTAMGFALSIQIAALSWILNTKYNLNIHEIGIVWAAGPIAGIFGQVIVGMISDKVWFWGGRRRPFILVGGALAALMLVALPNIDKINSFLNFTSLIVIATIVALSLDLAINISFNPTRSIIADITPEGTPRTKGYTWMQTISGTFAVLAYLIGALFGNYFLIYLGAVIVILFSVIPMFVISEPRELKAETLGDEKTTSVNKTQWGQLFRLYFAHGFSWIGIQTMFVYIIIFIKQKMFGVTDFSAKLGIETDESIGKIIAISFLILNAIGALLPAFVLEPFTEKLGRVRTHLICVAIMALGYFGIVLFGSTPISLYVLMAVLGIGWAAVVSLPFAIMSEKVDKNRMGFFMGIFNLSVVLPQLIVSLVLGFFIESFHDKNLIFLISGVTLTISAALWFLVKEEK